MEFHTNKIDTHKWILYVAFSSLIIKSFQTEEYNTALNSL